MVDAAIPGLDGIAVCRALKADPGTAAIPVVILTAAERTKVLERARAAGADAFVPKPFSPTALLALVPRLLPPDRAARGNRRGPRHGRLGRRHRSTPAGGAP